jgi:type VI secretion system protein ImpK
MSTEPRPPIDDPFATSSGERSFIKPKPGGWSASRSSAETATSVNAGEPQGVDHGLNPLLAAANRLLLLVPQLRQSRQVPTPRRCVHRWRRASVTSPPRHRNAASRPRRVMAGRYVLCTMLDEAAADTPWGGSGVWGRHSLLAEFHNEAFGGEKVFQLMARLAEKPEANRDLLELIYAALALGFEGRYRVIDNGRAQLEAVRAKLAQIVAQQRGPYPAALAQHWQAEPMAERKALTWLPLALVGAGVLLLLAAVYAAFTWSLSGRADPVYGRIQSLRLTPPVAAVAQPAALPRLAVLLQPDVRARTVEVRDEVDRSVVTVRGDGLFAPASSTLMPEREALMQRIAEALVRVGGQVLITGHTDNTPMRSLRFPSNWHLSEDRARGCARSVRCRRHAGGPHPRRGPRRRRAGGRQRHGRQPRPEPPRRGHAVHGPARSAGPPGAGAAAGSAPACQRRWHLRPPGERAMRKLLGFVFNRWVALVLLLVPCWPCSGSSVRWWPSAPGARSNRRLARWITTGGDRGHHGGSGSACRCGASGAATRRSSNAW